MSEHTREPWIASGRNQNNTIDIWSMDCRHFVAAEATDANARRIVACVNACAGMADPAAEIAKLKARCERLTEALIKARRFSAWMLKRAILTNEADQEKEAKTVLDLARAAIAESEE